MAGALHKTMVYLGLSDDETPEKRTDEQFGEYEEGYEDFDESFESDEREAPRAAVTPLRSAMRPVDSPVDAVRRITTIHPRTYNDAKAIGGSFREGTPVIMNLSDMDDADAKRLVDFSAGLIFGLRGSIERVTAKVFLLTPENFEVASEPEAPADTQASFFNQS